MTVAFIADGISLQGHGRSRQVAAGSGEGAGLTIGGNACYKRSMTAKEILELRNVLGYTQEVFAEAIGTHRVTIARWETGVNSPTGAALKNLRELAERARRKGM